MSCQQIDIVTVKTGYGSPASEQVSCCSKIKRIDMLHRFTQMSRMFTGGRREIPSGIIIIVLRVGAIGCCMTALAVRGRGGHGRFVEMAAPGRGGLPAMAKGACAGVIDLIITERSGLGVVCRVKTNFAGSAAAVGMFVGTIAESVVAGAAGDTGQQRVHSMCVLSIGEGAPVRPGGTVSAQSFAAMTGNATGLVSGSGNGQTGCGFVMAFETCCCRNCGTV